MSETIMFAGVSSCLWVASGLLSGAFSLPATANPDVALSSTARTCVVCGCLYALGVAGTAGVNAGLGASELGPTLTPEAIEGFVGLNLALIVWRRVYSELWPL
jgi:hypothetical protein